MRVIILTWEFPPRIVGAIAFNTNALAVELARRGIDISVVTFHDTWTGFHRGADGVNVWRVTNPIKAHINVLTWNLSLMTEFERVASDIYYSTGDIDLIDAHEWLCVNAAVALKKAFGIPFIYTVYTLEDHRSLNPNNPLSMAIRNLEHLGLHAAERVAVGSQWMKDEVKRLHGISFEKVDIVRSDPTLKAEDILQIYDRVAAARPKVLKSSGQARRG